MNFHRVLKIGLLLSPLFIFLNFFYPLGLSVRELYVLYFQLFTAVGLAILIRNKWIRCFLVLAIVCLFKDRSFFTDLRLWQIRWVTYGSYLNNMVWGCVLFFLVSNFIKKQEIKGILRVLSWVCLIMAGWIGLQVIGFFPREVIIPGMGKCFINQCRDVYGNIIAPNWNVIGYPGLAGQPNIQGAYLAILSPLFLVFGKIKKVPVGLFIVLAGIGFTHSIMAAVSACAGILAFQWLKEGRNNKHLIITGIGLLAGLVLLIKFVHFPEIAPRLLALKLAVGDSTWWGKGLGAFSLARLFETNVTRYGWMKQAHNEYAQVLYEMGRVGAFLVAGYVITTVRKFVRHKDKSIEIVALESCVIALLVNCMGNFTFHHSLLALIGLVLLGLIEVIEFDDNKLFRKFFNARLFFLV